MFGSQGTRWLAVYTYLYLPLCIFRMESTGSAATPGAYNAAGVYGAAPQLMILAESLLVFLAFGVLVGLHYRKFWAWQLNWLLLVVTAWWVLPQGNGSAALLSIPLKVLLFLLPNVFYFYRRKHLFS